MPSPTLVRVRARRSRLYGGQFRHAGDEWVTALASVIGIREDVDLIEEVPDEPEAAAPVPAGGTAGLTGPQYDRMMRPRRTR